MVMSGAMDNGVAKSYGEIISKDKEGDLIEAVSRFGFYDRADEVAGIIVTNDGTTVEVEMNRRTSHFFEQLQRTS